MHDSIEWDIATHRQSKGTPNPKAHFTPLEDEMVEPLPRRVASNLGSGGVDRIPVNWSASSVNIHLGGSEPSLTLPEVTADPEAQDDWEGKVGLEEATGITDVGTVEILFNADW